MKEISKISRVKVLETFALFAAVSLLPVIFYQRQAFTLLTLVLLCVGLLMKSLAEVVTRWWLQFSAILSGINNRVILAVLFYLILTPIAFIYRLFNKDPLNLDLNGNGSFYSERNHTYSKADLEKMW